jgi:hypothetical protein
MKIVFSTRNPSFGPFSFNRVQSVLATLLVLWSFPKSKIEWRPLMYIEWHRGIIFRASAWCAVCLLIKPLKTKTHNCVFHSDTTSLCWLCCINSSTITSYQIDFMCWSLRYIPTPIDPTSSLTCFVLFFILNTNSTLVYVVILERYPDINLLSHLLSSWNNIEAEGIDIDT